MSLWDYLFDNNYRQRDDIDALEHGSLASDQRIARLQRALADQARQVGNLELTVEALVHLLEERDVLTHDELALMVQRIDLADGIEDGQIGPDQSLDRPSCHVCRRPVNPRRDVCIYCNTPVVKGGDPTPVRTIPCASCGKQVPELKAFFGDRGMVCGDCHRE